MLLKSEIKRIAKAVGGQLRTADDRPLGKVYLSGPIIGTTYNEARYGWRERAANGFANGIEALSPMRHENHLAETTGPITDTLPDHYFSRGRVIVKKDKLDIDRCDIMLVYLKGAERISIGTVCEIGMAYSLGKPIVTVMEDAGNLHDHPFVRETSALVVDTLDDAIDAINSLLSTGV